MKLSRLDLRCLVARAWLAHLRFWSSYAWLRVMLASIPLALIPWYFGHEAEMEIKHTWRGSFDFWDGQWEEKARLAFWKGFWTTYLAYLYVAVGIGLTWISIHFCLRLTAWSRKTVKSCCSKKEER